MRVLLEHVANPSLEAAEVLTALADLYGGARREDREALRYLGQAEAALRGAGFAPPGGRDIAQALISALMSAGVEDKAQIGAFNDQTTSNGLFKRIFGDYEKIYRRQGRFQEADRYLRWIEDADGTIRDGSRTNLEFTEEMTKNLDSLMKKLSGLA